jgi:malonyl CoA-acyl carrier protein transacylase
LNCVVFFFLGSTGHSQGIVSAVAVSASDSYISFTNNSKKALTLLYFIGLRSAQVFPSSFLSPRIRDDSVQHNEGHPTPMLSITNLYEEDLNSCIETVNKQLPPNKRICVALQNGPKTFVCSGPSESLYGLNVYLRSIKARPDEDQTRIPFHERKKYFTTRYLGMSVGFHCEYLKEALSLLQHDIENFQLNWETKQLKIPVLSTYDGTPSLSISVIVIVVVFVVVV